MISELKSMKWNERIAVIFAMTSGVLAVILVFADILGYCSFVFTFKGMMMCLVMMGIGIAFLPPPQMWYKR